MTEPAAAPTPTPAPAAGGVPIVTDAARLMRALFSPGDVFTEIREAPTFWGPWIVVSILFIAAQFLLGPFQLRAQELALAAQGREMPAAMAKFRYVGLAVTPVIVLVFAAISAGVLWLGVMATGEEGPFKKLLVINIFTWPVAIIQQLVVFGVLRMRGIDAVQSVADLQVSLGLDLLLPADGSKFVHALAGGVNPFGIWGLVIAAVGLQTLLKLPSGKAWTVAIGAFLVSLVVAASLAGVFGGMGGG